jgi:hypothetical protein
MGGQSGEHTSVGARFPTPIQGGPGAHTASYTNGTSSLTVVMRPGCGVHQPSPSSTEVKDTLKIYI